MEAETGTQTKEADVKSTPGPWEVIYKATRGRDAIMAVDDQWIATVGQSTIDNDCAPGNAHLMAAAPDLLAACKALVAVANELKDDEHGEHADDCIMCQAVAVANEAIAKAEDQSHE